MPRAFHRSRVNSNPTELFKRLLRTAPYQPATNYWRAIELDTVIKHGLPEGLGLDLGCGDGKLTKIVHEALGSAQRRWVGLDVDPEETALARSVGLYERIHTSSADAIPEADGTFDFIFSNSVLEHVPPIGRTLAEAARTLRPGGRFVATVPGPEFHALLAGPVFSNGRARYLCEVDTRCMHLRYWSESEWKRELAAVGLDVISIVGYLNVQQVRTWERVSALTGGLVYTLGGRRARPIALQRKFGLRSESPGAVGRAFARLCFAALSDRHLDANAHAGPSGCLLIDAVKR